MISSSDSAFETIIHVENPLLPVPPLPSGPRTWFRKRPDQNPRPWLIQRSVQGPGFETALSCCRKFSSLSESLFISVIVSYYAQYRSFFPNKVLGRNGTSYRVFLL
ncbi:hypothetical protein EJ08DRAFT_651669 [Tothia fuscella]|uniref:Uncharacterized protein n=1 Tax=Tothia fuscella TaxID=1048955 RepID=A0A9P4TV40_9PEZI|nr:hypothetical protein EJ08DRAFT_651669 [Tothia fuscella]